MEDVDDLLAADRAHVWHPYAAMPAAVPPLPVVSAQGVRLRLADGRELVDGMSSWWAAVHGYRHPVLDAAVRDQLGAMSHVMFGGLTHGPAVELARLLVDVTPTGLEHVFFCDSGSVSVEVAIKLALQYQVARGNVGRTRMLTVRGGYHGRWPGLTPGERRDDHPRRQDERAVGGTAHADAPSSGGSGGDGGGSTGSDSDGGDCADCADSGSDCGDSG